MPETRPTPDPDDVVRRLLVEARHDEPVPDEVAQRLDRVLDGLQQESARDASADTSESVDSSRPAVVTLDARRARLRATARLLVAAAAVVVVGVGVARVVADRDTSSSSDSTASTVQESRSDAGKDAGDDAGGGTSLDSPGSTSGSTGDSTGGSPLSSPAPPSTAAVGPLDFAAIQARLPVALGADTLGRDVRAAVLLAAQLEPSLQSDGPVAAALAEPLPGWTCGSGTSTRAYGAGVLLPATYDGSPVVLALRTAAGDGLPVDVLACGSGDVIRSTIVDAG